MAIVKYKNQSGITYAYESVSSWDPVKKQSRPKRTYLGRVDPETGEIIKTEGKRGRPKKKAAAAAVQPDRSLAGAAAQNEMENLRRENAALKAENDRLRQAIRSACRELEAAAPD